MTQDVYTARGFGGSQRRALRPCLVVVDLSNAFTDDRSPLACDVTHVLDAVTQLLTAARRGGFPVVFTTVEYDESSRRIAQAYIAKAPSLAMLEPGSRWSAIDERVAPAGGEPVLVKLFASAFFGTPLSALLANEKCDGVVVVGASTSGCVRATAVDALQHGYSVVVPRDAVGDRAPDIHAASLRDLQAKYADVVDLAHALDVFSGPSPA